jgi:hypothetical protein
VSVDVSVGVWVIGALVTVGGEAYDTPVGVGRGAARREPT